MCSCLISIVNSLGIYQNVPLILKLGQTRQQFGNMVERFAVSLRYETAKKNIWTEYEKIARDQCPKVNLGPGYADYHGPTYLTDALAKIAYSHDVEMHQYTRGYGHPRLIKAIAQLYSPLVKQEINPSTEVLVGSGAYECLFCAIHGNIDKGDEVILIEPAFDCYEPMIRSAEGIPRFIPLKPKENIRDTVTSADWVLDEKELADMFNENTKMIIINTPHNPTGKVFTDTELENIAELCKKFNIICLCDEVYEWMVYQPKRHVRMASLQDMWERTITVGSAGKTFCVTGWRIGWAYGPEHLIKNLFPVHTDSIHTCCTPVQEALSIALEMEIERRDNPSCYLNSLICELTPKRDLIVRVLKEIGFRPTVPEGGFFVLADWSQLANKIDLSAEPDQYKDYKFTKKFAKEVGVLSIPMSAFYCSQNKHLGEKYARFCFIKKDENLKLAADLMTEWFKKIKAV